ncbi:hypothetical protein TcasGA2_TC033909 [Tribolium castaneum]|uniref:Uncharacterized protein n=1 Tax=Tribolium castaneum TaxID=7070 RepID=A0A139W8D2_TRICA|nr:hypothetical protein TcasGA2_TC033909 [Tribolium castaneum]
MLIYYRNAWVPTKLLQNSNRTHKDIISRSEFISSSLLVSCHKATENEAKVAEMLVFFQGFHAGCQTYCFRRNCRFRVVDNCFAERFDGKKIPYQ